MPTRSCIFKMEFCIVLPIFNNEFRNIKKGLALRKLILSLFHSIIEYGKKSIQIDQFCNNKVQDFLSKECYKYAI